MENEPESSPSLPVEELLINVANGVVKAQRRLDEASFATQLRIQEEELDKQFGLKATWYTIPELDFDLKLAFEVDSRGGLQSRMVDPDYATRYGFNVKASSELKTKIVAVPPAQGEGYRMLDKKRAVDIAGRIKRMVERYLESQSPHFAVHFQTLLAPGAVGYAGGLWYVLLIDTSSDGKRLSKALCVISDETSEILRYWDEQDNAPITIKNVEFSFQEQVQVLDFINTADGETLDIKADIDSRAVKTIISRRPYYDFATLAKTQYIGEETWLKIKKQMSGEGGAQNLEYSTEGGSP